MRRESCFGTQSTRRSRFAVRMPIVTQTLRLQRRCGLGVSVGTADLPTLPVIQKPRDIRDRRNPLEGAENAA